MIPTLFGIMTVNFLIIQAAPGGPVERTIAVIQGFGTDATERVSGSDMGEVMDRAQSSELNSKYRGSQGLDPELIAEFEALADEVRYPEQISDADVREVKRIKARVEAERLPQGADPARHLKLGRGSLSDVEWFVQLLQLQHAARVPELRTTSTLGALSAAVEAELVTASDAARLREAWIIASRARSAMTLWTAKTADVLPSDRRSLEGVARLMEYPRYSASQLEEDYLRLTRLARQVFERGFYGIE